MKFLLPVVVATLFIVKPAFSADDMKGMKDGMMSPMMKQMMTDPHHRLGMAYMKNIRNFAEALKSEVTSTGKVDKDFAMTAVGEMKQSLQQMRKHHEEMQNSMSGEMKGKTAEMVKMMENRLSMTQQHLDSLEKEVNAEMPDPKKVSLEADQIVKQCKMMEMPKKGAMKKSKQGR